MKNLIRRTFLFDKINCFTQKLLATSSSNVYKLSSKPFIIANQKQACELGLGKKLFKKKFLTSEGSFKKFSEISVSDADTTKEKADKKENLNENTENLEAKISINYGNIKGTKSGNSGHYIIMFTCTKCDNRTTRMFTKHSYHHGVVLIRCECCEGVHLIADNLGWFDDGISNIEQFLKFKGEELKKLSVNGLFSFAENNSTTSTTNNNV